MKAFTFHDGELIRGIQLSNGTGKGNKKNQLVLLGEHDDRPVKVKIDATSPPVIEEGMVYDIFPSITPAGGGKPTLSKPQFLSNDILLRINTSSADPRFKNVRGGWQPIFGRVGRIAMYNGKDYKDAIVKLYPGNALIVTIQGGGNKYCITNYQQTIYCSEVTKVFKLNPSKKKSDGLSENQQVVHHDKPEPEKAIAE